jgi:hypothetical protein
VRGNLLRNSNSINYTFLISHTIAEYSSQIPPNALEEIFILTTPITKHTFGNNQGEGTKVIFSESQGYTYCVKWSL